jgi:peptidoglycan/LPS O-acetylase OafA/YrhL
MKNKMKMQFKTHNNNFGFLRLLLAILVILSHSPLLIDGNKNSEFLISIFHTISFGEIAVDGFFLLSGYLIIQSWQRNPKFISFMKKRILRIYPGFIVAILFCLYIVIPIGLHSIRFPPQSNLIISLKEMFWLSPPSTPIVFREELFKGQPFPVLNGSMWTISYEFRCYVLVAIFGIIGVLNKRRLWLLISVATLIIYLFPGSTFRSLYPKSSYLWGDFGEMIRFFAFFCSGGCFYLWRDRIKYSKTFILPALFILIISLFFSNAVNFALITVGAYLFFAFSFLELPILSKFATFPDISYGVYLYGWPIQKLLVWYFPLISSWLLFVVATGLCFVFGWLSWTFVEKPCLRLRGVDAK